MALTVPSPLPSSMTGRLIREAQHDALETVDRPEIPQLIEEHLHPDPSDGLQRRAARCLLSLPFPPWPAHRRLVSPLCAQSPLEPFLVSATNPRADLDPAGGLRSGTGTAHDPSVAADRCAGAERACRRARLAPNTSSIECVSPQTRPFWTVTRFRKRGAKGTDVLALDTFVNTELAAPIARGLLAPATFLSRYAGLGFVHLLRVGLAPLATQHCGSVPRISVRKSIRLEIGQKPAGNGSVTAPANATGG